jgi:hypothetical protein
MRQPSKARDHLPQFDREIMLLFLEIFGRVADGQKSAPKGGSQLIGRAQEVARACREKRRNEKGAKSLKTTNPAKWLIRRP